MENTLVISSPGSPLRSAVVDPVVILSLLDHHTRRHEDQTFVFGALLGSVNDAGDVDVRASLPLVQAGTDAKSLEANIEFQQVLYDLHQKVNTRDSLLGWYASVGEIPEILLKLHDICLEQLALPEAVILSVDTDIQNGLKINMSYSVQLNNLNGHLIQPLPYTIKLASQAERVGWDVIRKAQGVDGKENENIPPQSTVMFKGEVENLKESLRNVYTMLADLEGIAAKMTQSPSKDSDKLGKNLLQLTSSLAWMDTCQLEQSFTNRLQDLMMVSYIANLTRTQLVLAEKLQNGGKNQ